MTRDKTTSFFRVSLDCNHFLDHAAYSYLPREKTDWTGRIKQRGSWPKEGKRALIQKLSSSLQLVILGIAILLPPCSKLGIWRANGQIPCLPAQPSFLAVLLAMLNPASPSTKKIPPPAVLPLIMFLFYFRRWCRKKSNQARKERSTESQERQTWVWTKHMRKNKTSPKTIYGSADLKDAYNFIRSSSNTY